MTTCNDCGGCCYPVVLAYHQSDIAAKTIGSNEEGPPIMGKDRINADDRRWMLEDLTPMPAREGFAMRPELRRPTVGIGPSGELEDQKSVFYTCRHYDLEARRCTNYDNRPPICRGFPWYGNTPHPAATLPVHCEFLRDVGRVPVPLIEKPS